MVEQCESSYLAASDCRQQYSTVSTLTVICLMLRLTLRQPSPHARVRSLTSTSVAAAAAAVVERGDGQHCCCWSRRFQMSTRNQSRAPLPSTCLKRASHHNYSWVPDLLLYIIQVIFHVQLGYMFWLLAIAAGPVTKDASTQMRDITAILKMVKDIIVVMEFPCWLPWQQ